MIVRTTASALRIRSLPTTQGETDTGKRLLPQQRATVYGKSLDEDWRFISAPQGKGWASAGFLVEADLVSIIDSVPWIERPHGLNGIREVFGPECGALASIGRVSLPRTLSVAWNPAQRIGTFACHTLMVPIFNSFFEEIHRQGLWHLLDDEWGGCYNCRMKSGTSTKRSTHSWGIAIDVAVSKNGFNRVPQLDRRIVALAADHRLEWGGNWSKPDAMHFQYATGY